jgi:hypothetical protein
MTATSAWHVPQYRNEYNAWVDAGRPKPRRFVSISATLAEQREFWQGLKATLTKVAKPMPKEDKQPTPKALPESNVVEGEFTKLEGDNNNGPISF